MDQKIKQYWYVAVAVVVVLGIGVFFISKKQVAKTVDQKSAEPVFETPSETIPTVDSSVIVAIKGKTEAVISFQHIPAGTKEIKYELSYNTASGSVEGVFGTVKPTTDSAEEKTTFGTCSSGVCRYHDIKGKVSGTFRFTGSYGQKLLEKDFTL